MKNTPVGSVDKYFCEGESKRGNLREKKKRISNVIIALERDKRNMATYNVQSAKIDVIVAREFMALFKLHRSIKMFITTVFGQVI